ncbi:mesoderm induction early response protein 3-like [Myotis daubentonii]|uniref:mesoderm induction early response protein 3-like n=1 Tax=Myotis daubentonii TaxID=98922 RepID=UPI0028736B24|nr:mesoderm induction early response protein 3-like [Myotis daubentonii]
MMDEGKNFSSEIKDLEKEGGMPLEDLLAFCGSEPVLPAAGKPRARSSPRELAHQLPDMTLDKEEIAKDLLSVYDEEAPCSADDLVPSLAFHQASDFFPRPLHSNIPCEGDKESEIEDGETDSGNSPEDWRKEVRIGLQYQAEIPPYLGEDDDDDDDGKASEDGEQLLWRPGVVAESTVKEYLVEAAFRTGKGKTVAGVSAGKLTRDDERALQELLRCGHNIQEALERYCRSGKASQEGMTAWTEEEIRSFEHALMIFGKDFHRVQKIWVKTRTVAECVAFYYMRKMGKKSGR